MAALRSVVYVGHILIGVRRNHELLTVWLDAADNPGSRATVPVRRGPECFLAGSGPGVAARVCDHCHA